MGRDLKNSKLIFQFDHNHRILENSPKTIHQCPPAAKSPLVLDDWDLVLWILCIVKGWVNDQCNFPFKNVFWNARCQTFKKHTYFNNVFLFYIVFCRKCWPPLSQMFEVFPKVCFWKFTLLSKGDRFSPNSVIVPRSESLRQVAECQIKQFSS